MANETKGRGSAGYSGTPLATKLGIKAGHRVALVAVPKDFELGRIIVPDNVSVVHSLRGNATTDVILVFCRNQRALDGYFPKARKRLAQSGGLWIAWPKKASGIQTDLSDSVVRQLGLDAGLVDNKVCAIDETWSGLRFVVRRKDRI